MKTRLFLKRNHKQSSFSDMLCAGWNGKAVSDPAWCKVESHDKSAGFLIPKQKKNEKSVKDKYGAVVIIIFSFDRNMQRQVVLAHVRCF